MDFVVSHEGVYGLLYRELEVGVEGYLSQSPLKGCSRHLGQFVVPRTQGHCRCYSVLGVLVGDYLEYMVWSMAIYVVVREVGYHLALVEESSRVVTGKLMVNLAELEMCVVKGLLVSMLISHCLAGSKTSC